MFYETQADVKSGNKLKIVAHSALLALQKLAGYTRTSHTAKALS